ncbi:DUF6364 family protein [Paenimyroides baculatum]|uniref:Antitoxin n=1 Tax=Paenimyroides baculatum TaxID=2608000 RepID=A0A5M6CAL0_9FLAO|nr:DUF6364 family protein [Paenimyroides baculatum]KAA5532023.1 hypothetical protein F0460_13490 [Paenimyroides baculatum]
MDSKLTLKLDENVIERAKKYAAAKKLSLSRLIENYLDALTNDELNNLEISPFVKSIATGKQLPNEIDKDRLKDDCIDYLYRKYR